MKITCQSCQAKYTIADEKVLGKILKIRCKKCAATIVVNGSDPSATTTTESAPLEPPRTREPAEPPQDGWTVNVVEGDQRTMTDGEVVAAFASGTIDGDTFFWKDGMEDWAALRELAPLYAACTAGTALPPASSPDPVARLGGSRTAGSFAAAGANGIGSAFAPSAAATAAQSAARRGGGRAPAADLFGGVAQAGGEEDVLTSAPSKMPRAQEDPQKGPIGARNENSVLFSMSAMTPKGRSERPATPSPLNTTEASGLIDIRQLSAQLIVEDKKRSRVDDIMNLSGGGAFLPNLAAPSLTAPAIDEYAGAGASGAPAGRNKGLIFLAVGAGAFLIVAAIGTATVVMHSKSGSAEPVASDKPVPVASTGDIPAAPSASIAMAAPPASNAPSAAIMAPAPPSATAKMTGPTGDMPKENKPAASIPVAVAAAQPREAPARPAAAEVDQPFNMGEAKAKLGAAASAAAGCKKASGPTGTGRVVVVFAPSGATQSASVSGAPFEGTPTGACVASRFRAVRIPAFSGSPFSVSKSFTIN
jgi:predicted Zn finger-like uncharacterized protein